MKRPVGVVITSVLQVLGSLVTLLLAGITAVVPRLAPKNPAQPEMPAGLFVAIAVFYFILALLGLATAAGISRLKQWARYSTLIFAGILVCVGLMMAVVLSFTRFPAPPNDAASAQLPPNFELIVKAVMVSLQLAIAALGAWWLYYFNRAKTKLRFMGQNGVSSTASGGRPLSIAILAVLNILGFPSMLVGAWMALPIGFLGIIAHGTAARAVYLIFAAAALSIGLGLWRLIPASRPAAIAFYAFGCLNVLLFDALPGRQQRYQEMLTESMQIWHFPQIGQQPPNFLLGVWAGLVSSLIVSAIAVYFLVTRRSAFERGSVPPSVPPPTFPAS